MRKGIITTVLVLAAVGIGWATGEDEIESNDPPETAFALPGSDLLYDRDRELRWEYENGILTIQTTEEEQHRVEVITPNVLRVTTRGRSRLLIRIGSSEYLAVIRYRECVKRNENKNLFELEECEVPPFAAGSS